MLGRPNEDVARACVSPDGLSVVIGGSTRVTPANTLATVVAIQNALAARAVAAEAEGDPAATRWRVTVVLFPCGAQGLSPSADAALFPMLLNTRDPRYLMGEPLRMAPLVRAHGVPPLPTAYLVCAPGGTVGRVADADLIQSDETLRMHQYALTAACFGFRLVYLEAGSGSHTPTELDLVRVAKEASRLPVVSSGGIRTPRDAHAAAAAGADWIVSGSLVERIADLNELSVQLRDLVDALRPTGTAGSLT